MHCVLETHLESLIGQTAIKSGHMEIAVYEAVDDKPRKPRWKCGLEIALKVVYRTIDSHYHREADNNWRRFTTCRISRCIWFGYDGRRAEFLMTLNRNKIVIKTSLADWSLPILEYNTDVSVSL